MNAPSRAGLRRTFIERLHQMTTKQLREAQRRMLLLRWRARAEKGAGR